MDRLKLKEKISDYVLPNQLERIGVGRDSLLTDVYSARAQVLTTVCSTSIAACNLLVETAEDSEEHRRGQPVIATDDIPAPQRNVCVAT